MIMEKENNKIIAEFMGYRECPQKLFRMDDEFQSVTIYAEYQDEDEYLTIEAGKRQIKYTPDEMEFHTSWEWLMPVVEKIKKTTTIDIHFLSSDYEGNNAVMVKIESINVCITDTSGKKAIYKAVVEFIKNQNK